MAFYTNAALVRGDVLLREVDDSGKHVKRRVKCKPFLFATCPESDATHRDIHGKPLRVQRFKSTWEASEFLKEHQGLDGFSVCGLDNFLYPWLDEEYPGDVQFDASKINTCFIDIEVAADGGFPDLELADKQVTAICCYIGDETHVFACLDYVPAEGVTYHRAADEETLLAEFMIWWRHAEVDILTGWYIDFFDVPYLVNRLIRLFGMDVARAISPWGIIRPRTVRQGDRELSTWSIVGVTVADLKRAYEKFTHRPQESYRLDHIAYVELGESKLDYSEYGSLNELYVQNPQKFVEYNVKDTHLVRRIDEKLGLLSLIVDIAYMSKVNFEDSFGTVKVWEAITHNYLLSRGIAVPPRRETHGRDFLGGYVKEPQVGLHDWVVSFDVDSLYPHLIRALNISPEKLRGQIPASLSVEQVLDGALAEYARPGHAVAASGHVYECDEEGHFPRLMREMYVKRDEAKAAMKVAKARAAEVDADTPEGKQREAEVSRLNNRQLALKYAMNSFYGAMSNRFFLWFDIRMAESITISGHVAIQWVARAFNEFVNRILGNEVPKDYVVAIDTDSNYVRFDEVVRLVFGDEPDRGKVVDFLDQICSRDGELGKVISEAFAEWARYHGGYDVLRMKRETVAERALWTAKKKYAMLAWDVEGLRYKTPEIKVTGIEVVRSSTPQQCRDKLKEALGICLSGTEDDLQAFVEKFKLEFESMPFEDVAFPRTANGLRKYSEGEGYKSGTPIQVRGALTYNRFLTSMKLDTRYPLIIEGDKIKFAYAVVPNPTGENVIAAPGILPRELGLDRFIDYRTQFEKAFVSPLDLVLRVIGWRHERAADLRAFMGE